MLFIHAVPDNKGHKDGYYCALVESRREDGKSKHHVLISFGFVPTQRVPYLKAAFNSGDPQIIFENEKRRLEERRQEKEDA